MPNWYHLFKSSESSHQHFFILEHLKIPPFLKRSSFFLTLVIYFFSLTCCSSIIREVFLYLLFWKLFISPVSAPFCQLLQLTYKLPWQCLEEETLNHCLIVDLQGKHIMPRPTTTVEPDGRSPNQINSNTKVKICRFKKNNKKNPGTFFSSNIDKHLQ